MNELLGASGVWINQFAAVARAHMGIGDRGWLQTNSFLGGRLTRTGKLRCRSRRKGGR